MTVMMVLEKSRKATALCSGKSSALLLGSRIRKRQIETFVHMRVAKVWILQWCQCQHSFFEGKSEQEDHSEVLAGHSTLPRLELVV